MKDYKNLLQYCNTENQKEAVKKCIEYGSPWKASQVLGRDYSNMQGIIRRLKQKAAKQGDAPEYDMTKPVPKGFHVERVSTYYNDEGKVKGQWVKSRKDEENYLEELQEALKNISKDYEGVSKETPKPHTKGKDLINVYISNDVHIGALMWGKETLDRDYDINIAKNLFRSSIDYLIENSPNAKYGLVCDLGDLLETDNFTNMTPKNGNILSVDGRYPKMLETAYMILIYAIDKALTKHEKVYFANISGNHDLVSGHAVREIIKAWYRNNKRVIIDESPAPIKYFQHGDTLLQFAHGDGLKMKDAGEVMVTHKKDIISQIKHFYSHFGHVHKDSGIYDGRITKAESHRNLAPLNDWASHMGFMRGAGTMKSITYSKESGEVARTIFNVDME